MRDKTELAYGKVAARDARCAITTAITGRSKCTSSKSSFLDACLSPARPPNSPRDLIRFRDYRDSETQVVFLSPLAATLASRRGFYPREIFRRLRQQYVSLLGSLLANLTAALRARTWKTVK